MPKCFLLNVRHDRLGNRNLGKYSCRVRFCANLTRSWVVINVFYSNIPEPSNASAALGFVSSVTLGLP